MSADALRDFAARLEAAGVATLWTDMHLGGRPASPDRVLTLHSYIGDGNRLHDASNLPADERIAVQVTARASTWGDADAFAVAAYRALPFRHYTVNGRSYAWGLANHVPAAIGSDENDRKLVVFNFTARRHGDLSPLNP